MSARAVVLSRRAARDLAELWDWIAVDRPAAADAALASVRAALDGLGEHPELGRARPELCPGLQSLPCGRLVVFYRVAASSVEVVRVLHGSRDIAALL